MVGLSAGKNGEIVATFSAHCSSIWADHMMASAVSFKNVRRAFGDVVPVLEGSLENLAAEPVKNVISRAKYYTVFKQYGIFNVSFVCTLLLHLRQQSYCTVTKKMLQLPPPQHCFYCSTLYPLLNHRFTPKVVVPHSTAGSM